MAMTGKVKWFNEVKGYGFITPDDNSRDVFVHASACEKANIELAEGDHIEFDTEPSKKEGKGPNAVNLKRVA